MALAAPPDPSFPLIFATTRKLHEQVVHLAFQLKMQKCISNILFLSRTVHVCLDHHQIRVFAPPRSQAIQSKALRVLTELMEGS